MSAAKSAAARPVPPGPASRKRRASAVPDAAPAVPDAASAALDAVAARAEAAFRAGVDAAALDAHAAGVPVAVLDADGRPAWLHPDGTTDPADPLGPAPRR